MQVKKELAQKWESLSPRQQHVVALACRGLTYYEISTRLGISEETVKTHMKNSMYKLEVHGTGNLQKTFKGWDFSKWG